MNIFETITAEQSADLSNSLTVNELSKPICVRGTQQKSVLVSTSGKVYKVWGSSTHRTGFFLIAKHPRHSTMFIVLKYVNSDKQP